MRLGIFESVFPRSTLADMFVAVAEGGFGSVQFDYASAGRAESANAIPAGMAQQAARAAGGTGIAIAAVSGTFNMIHPNVVVREAGIARLDAVARSCPTLGCDIVTLCTGTRDTGSMWRHHPDNASPGAWSDLVNTMTAALEIADRHGVRLVVEPEPANVVRDAGRAKALLAEMAHDRLKIVLDPANILAGDRERSPEVALDRAFDTLGGDIILAHAKDLDHRGAFCAAGTGIVPWAHYRHLLAGIGYDADVIFHTLSEDQVPAARATFDA